MSGTDSVGRVKATSGGGIVVWGTGGAPHPPTAALGCQSRCCSFMLLASAGAWQVDEKTTALMFLSAGNAAINRGGEEGDGGGVEGKEGLER